MSGSVAMPSVLSISNAHDAPTQSAAISIDGLKDFGPASASRQDLILVDDVWLPRLTSEGRPIHSTDEGTANFWRWFGGSAVVQADGRPVVAYRGEHGDHDGFLVSHLGSITFSDTEAGNGYALEPNQNIAFADRPRVLPAFLSVTRPFINTPDDPFIEFADIIRGVGIEQARRIALKFADEITETGPWQEGEIKAASVAELISQEPERLSELYMRAWPFFDDPAEVSLLSEKGFDGAIHGGMGAFDGPEYRVFSPEQAMSLYNDGQFVSKPSLRFIEPSAIADASPVVPASPSHESHTAQSGLIHPTDEGVANFWRWFGDSAAAMNGRPLVLYHGTTKPFDSFEPSSVGTFGAGIYFCEAPSANVYAQDEGGLVMPVFLRVRNPYHLQVDDAVQEAHDLDSPGLPLVLALFEGDEQARLIAQARHRDFGLLTEDVTACLQAMGHDGIVATYPDGCQEWVVFDAAQVKSALGNSGAFAMSGSSLTDCRRLDGPALNQVFAPRLADAETLAAYINEHSGEDVDVDAIEEFFVGAGACLRRVKVADLIAGDPDHNLPDEYRQARYDALPVGIRMMCELALRG